MAAAGAKVVVNDIGASLTGEGAAAGPATMVNRAPGTSSASLWTRPEDRTASPIRVAVMNRIGKGAAGIADT